MRLSSCLLLGAIFAWAQIPAPNAVGVSAGHDILTKVRVSEDRSIATPIASDTLYLSVPDVAAAQARHERWFGAKLVKKGSQMAGDIPDSNLVFVRASEPVTGTNGRAGELILS